MYLKRDENALKRISIVVSLGEGQAYISTGFVMIVIASPTSVDRGQRW